MSKNDHLTGEALETAYKLFLKETGSALIEMLPEHVHHVHEQGVKHAINIGVRIAVANFEAGKEAGHDGGYLKGKALGEAAGKEVGEAATLAVGDILKSKTPLLEALREDPDQIKTVVHALMELAFIRGSELGFVAGANPVTDILENIKKKSS